MKRRQLSVENYQWLRDNTHLCPSWNHGRDQPCNNVIADDREFCEYHRRRAEPEQYVAWESRLRDAPRHRLASRLDRARRQLANHERKPNQSVQAYRRALQGYRYRIRKFEHQLAELANQQVSDQTLAAESPAKKEGQTNGINRNR